MTDPTDTTSTYRVSGMTCEHCVAAVSGEIAKIGGVTAVDVDLASGRVDIHSEAPVEAAAVAAAVDEAGYELVP